MNEDELPLLPAPVTGGQHHAPGDFIRRELELRGWGQAELARIIGRPLPTVNEIIQGKRAIMPEMAVALGSAFGNGAMFWMQKESAYRLSLVEQSDPETQERARLYDLAPVSEMEKRGWIKPTRTPKELERELCRFFGVDSLEEDLTICGAARQSFPSDEFTSPQRAWAFRAMRLATALNANPFKHEVFVSGLSEIRTLAFKSEKLRHIPKVLAELGVRLVVVEPFAKSRIDGAIFWLRDSDQPVIVLSLRYDRIDWLWHTLAHELIHVKYKDRRSIDSNLVGETRIAPLENIEERADREGAELLIPTDKLKSFIIRTKPFYSKERILQFSQRLGIHPGIVSGQLQHAGELKWSANREMLVKVRDLLTSTALTDGWGKPTIKF